MTFEQLHVGRGVDISCRGCWRRVGRTENGDQGWTFRYYWRNVRVPWLAWAMFSASRGAGSGCSARP